MLREYNKESSHKLNEYFFHSIDWHNQSIAFSSAQIFSHCSFFVFAFLHEFTHWLCRLMFGRESSFLSFIGLLTDQHHHRGERERKIQTSSYMNEVNKWTLRDIHYSLMFFLLLLLSFPFLLTPIFIRLSQMDSKYYIRMVTQLTWLSKMWMWIQRWLANAYICVCQRICRIAWKSERNQQN